MNQHSGQSIQSSIQHIEQSLRDIFTTPIGSRIQRRHYGSHVFQLLDAPLNGVTRLQLMAALVDAAHRWEPRIRIDWLWADWNPDGRLWVELQCQTQTGESFSSRIFLNVWSKQG